MEDSRRMSLGYMNNDDHTHRKTTNNKSNG